LAVIRDRFRAVGAWFARRGWSPLVAGAYLTVIGLFGWAFSEFYIPGKGFSSLIAFGSQFESARLSKIRKLDYYVEKDSDGYDAQYYAQIAMDPSLQNKQLRNAVDSLPYRARRILMPALSYVFGFGEPAAILQAYATMNALTWLLLAVLLLHWFPPSDWDNFLRWAGMLGTFGLSLSVRHALTDGPSLLLLAFGVYLFERQRPWLAAGVLGLSGLAKETSVLGATAFVPRDLLSWRNWPKAIGLGLLVGLPLALWLGYIDVMVGAAADVGARNFDLPFMAYCRKWAATMGGFNDFSLGAPGAHWSLVSLIVLSVQFLFLVARPRWSSPWWRIGVCYALLMVFLGDAVWEGYPGAAARVLLPMQLAFNVLVPREKAWRWVLILGNLSLLAAPAALAPPNSNAGFQLRAEPEFFAAPSRATMRVEMSSAWHQPEQGSAGYRIWSRGNATVTIVNPHARPLLVRLRFEMNAEGARGVRLRLGERDLWSVTIPEGGKVAASLPRIELAPGVNRIEFLTDQPPRERPPDPRVLAFCVHNLRIDVQDFVSETK